MTLKVPLMRLLFLDFDGVLHPASSDGQLAHFCWLPLLESLLSAHEDVAVVVHSTWRYEYRDDELRELLGPLGRRFVGAAPRGPREEVIETVLEANKRSVTSHLVLDDAAHEFTGGTLNTLFVDGSRGISDVATQQSILEWLDSSARALEIRN
jgi:hypothetical protein